MLVTSQIKNKPPRSIRITSGFIILCAVALVVFDIALILASLKVSNNPVYATGTRTKGFICIAFLILLGALLLVMGVRSLLEKGRPTVLFVILGISLAFGTIGEVVDLFGTASGASNLIGACILLLFAIPISLLLLPSSRKWYAY